jgi:predicted dehydrogenase
MSRRGLIELGIGASAAAVATSGHAAAKPDDAPWGPALPEGEKLGFAIVGIGKLSQGQLIPGLRKCKGARLSALVSGHPDKAAEWAAKEGVPADAIYNYENFDRIANDPRIDVVYIVLPNSMHAEFTIRALKAGKHVLCEKPMAVNAAECEAMIAAAKKAKRHLMIAYRCHYEPHNLEAMRRIRSKKYGKPRLVVTEMGRQSSLSDPADVWRLDMKMSGGGALTDMGIYGVNGMRYLLNEEPVEVRAWANTDHSDPRFKDTEDLISWQFKFPSGALGHGSTSFSYGGCMKWDVFCENARIRCDPGAYYGGIQLDILSHPDQGNVKIADIDQFAREMDWMADVVRGKVPMVAPGEEGLQDVRLMEAILESVRKGGATIKTDWGYKRAVDPAAVVDVPA